jgi:hypothetical protein
MGGTFLRGMKLLDKEKCCGISCYYGRYGLTILERSALRQRKVSWNENDIACR